MIKLEQYKLKLKAMPIPTPNQGEHEKEFIQRCMTNDKMVSEYPDTDQRYTVCRTQIANRKSQIKGSK